MAIVEFIFIALGLLFVLYALIAFVYRLVKREPFWPNLKKLIVGIVDGVSGMG